jgi:hypothetical protein
MTDYADLKSAAAPEAMRAALAARADELVMAAHPHHPSAMADIREAEYRGHRIEVRTSYAITVDGRPFDIHIVVDNEGRVYYHGLPTRDFPSVIDLVKRTIDQFAADFEPGGTDQGHPHGPGHPHEPGHMHTEATEGHGNSQGEGN